MVNLATLPGRKPGQSQQEQVEQAKALINELLSIPGEIVPEQAPESWVGETKKYGQVNLRDVQSAIERARLSTRHRTNMNNITENTDMMYQHKLINSKNLFRKRLN